MYNYNEAMKQDITSYINTNIDLADYVGNRDGLEQELNDDLFTEDSITGNASGSYTFSRSTAREYVEDNADLVREACKEFCIEADTIAEKFLDADYEYFDVTVRCYLLGQVISEVLDELESNGLFEEEVEEVVA